MDIIISIILGITLSIDVIFIAMVYSTRKDNNLLLLPFTIGILHFVLPLLSYTIFSSIDLSLLNNKLIPTSIFLYLGISTIISNEEDSELPILSYINILLLSFSVSIDSFFMGISLCYSSINFLMCFSIFGLCAFASTFIAIKVGQNIKKRVDIDLSTPSGIVFILMSLLFFNGII